MKTEAKLVLQNNSILIDQASATYGTRAKRGTWNDFQWNAEWTEIQ